MKKYISDKEKIKKSKVFKLEEIGKDKKGNSIFKKYVYVGDTDVFVHPNLTPVECHIIIAPFEDKYFACVEMLNKDKESIFTGNWLHSNSSEKLQILKNKIKMIHSVKGICDNFGACYNWHISLKNELKNKGV